LPPALSGVWSAVADGDADGGRARPVRQDDGAALGGGQRLHRRRRGAARRRRRSDHHEQPKHQVPPCRPHATPTGRTHPIGAGKRLAKKHKHARSSASTTRRWRRRGRRIGALLPHCAPLAARRHRHARHACTSAARHAEAAFFGVRRHTRGMTCASRCAQSFAPIGRQQTVRAHTALPPTVRVARRKRRSRARGSRRTASLALRPLCRQSGMVLQAQPLMQAKAEVRPLHPPARPRARIHDTPVAAEGRIARMRAFGALCSTSIVERLPPTPTACRQIEFFRV
jgi:hypothetical protein